MKPLQSLIKRLLMAAICICLSSQCLNAQTDVDAILLKKKVLCVGGMYVNDSWTNYWEGTYKRNNQNIGKVTTQMFAVMGNYGITDRLNVMFTAPYVTTKVTKGTLSGLEGVQDLSLMLKYLVTQKKFGSNDKLSVYAIGRVSTPLTNYVADFLPVSIGLRSKTAGIRALADYQYDKYFISASGAYTFRSNINIDRNAYYTTEMHYTNEVEMHDAASFNVRAGYRSKYWVAEGIFDRMNTLGGFDIRKNDMPFPSNKMNATRLGGSFKHTLKAVKGLEIVGGAMYTIAGRNVGQSTSINAGVFYLMNFSSHTKPVSNQQQQ
jgi:hypothetical protein